MNRKLRKMMIFRHFRARRWILLPIALFVYVVVLSMVAPEKNVPEAAVGDDNRHPIFDAENVTDFKIRNNVKLVLVWTRLQNTYTQWNLSPGPIRATISRETPPGVTCRHENCVVTYDKRHLGDADAVLLSLYDLKIYLALGPTLARLLELVTFGAVDVYSVDGLPPFKPRGQKWVLFWSEPPNILFRYIRWTDILAPLDDVIDWTVSYRQDSTIFRPYCYALKKDTPLQDFMNNYTARFLPHGYDKSYDKKRVESRSTLIANNAPLKSNRSVKIVWFVSNCNSASKREEFVRQLSEEDNIEIDVFGACGTLKCDRSLGGRCHETLLPR